MIPGFIVLCLAGIILLLFMRIQVESGRLEARKKSVIEKDQPPVNVLTLELIPGTVRETLNLPGAVEPWTELKLSALVEGMVIKQSVKEGDFVDEDDIIAIIDPRDFENRLKVVKADLTLAKSNLKRSEELYKGKFIPRHQLDDALSRKESLEGTLKNTLLELERTTIRAPISGIVNKLYAKKGVQLQKGDPAAYLIQTDRVKVIVGIPESDIAEVRRLDYFTVSIDALSGRVFNGKRYFISQTPETMARLYRLEIEVSNENGEILPGMFGDVSIIKKEVTNALSLPVYSVISLENDSFVYIEDKSTAYRRQVKTGILDGWNIEIKSGLHAGDHVIVRGHRNVDEGRRVNVVRHVADPGDLLR